MKSKLKLNEGETLRQDSWRAKGSLGETDIYKYSIIDASGNIVGSVEYEDHTSIRGFNRTQSVTQWDKNGKIVLDERW